MFLCLWFLLNEKKELELEIRSLKEEIYCLSLYHAIQSVEIEITTFENGKYTDDVRTCIYELLSLNVGVLLGVT